MAAFTRLFALFLAGCALVAPVAADPPSATPAGAGVEVGGADLTVVDGKIGERLDDYLSRLEAYGFHGAALYAKKDRIYLRKGYGYASVEEKRRNTPETLFDIASVSKQFTCAGILRLQMRGKLRTDDPITKFFPILADGDDKSEILLFHLMNQTSGLSSAIPATERTKDRDRFIELVRDTPNEAEPGERFEYNNLNFALLGAVIEVVSGKTYEAFMQEEVFRPAGMMHVHHLGEHLPAGTYAAMGHRGDWEMWSAEEGWYSWALRAAAGTLCSLNDLYTWELALRGNAVLDENSKREFFNRLYPSYAYGWFARDDTDPKRTVFYHGGNTIGFQAHFERCPKDDSVLILLINMAGKIRPVSAGLRSLIDGHGASMPPKPVPMAEARLAEIAGTYVIEEGMEFGLTVEDGALVARGYGEAAAAWRLKQRTEADLKRSPRYDTMAEEALQSWHVGDLEPLIGLFREGQERRAHEFVSEWASVAQAGGGLKDVRVLGTLPISLEELHTYVTLASQERADVVKLIWHAGELQSWDHIYPGVMRFVPVGETEFISFEITDEITPRDRAMKFVLDEAGKPARVAILIDFVRIFADRKKE